MDPSKLHDRNTNSRTRLSKLGASQLLLIALVGSSACTVATAENEAPGAVEGPSICGESTDWQDVETYNGALGPSVDFVNRRERPVGHLTPIGCSGTLIARDVFLTAGHCVSASTPGSQVRFNFQRDPNGNVRTTTNYAVSAVLEDDVGGVDYAVLQLNGSPGDVWGTSTPAVFAPAAGQPITIIQHPNGIPKVVEGGTLGYTNGRMSYGDLDTEGGSSGSGILQDRTGYVIGVHTNGTTCRIQTAASPWSASTLSRPSCAGSRSTPPRSRSFFESQRRRKLATK
jgi:hypothetical protein